MSVSVYQLESGKWRADVIVTPLRRSKVKRLKADVKRWATDTEAELIRLVATGVAMKRPTIVTFDAALVQYGIDKSSLKKTYQNEMVKINTLRTTLPNIDWPIDRITDEHLSGWRDDLIRRGLSDGTILRYFSLLGSIFEWARTEKKWLKINPCRDVKKPKKPPHRERRIIGDEIDAIVAAAKYKVGTVPRNKTQETVLAWLIGMTTGMRVSEIIGSKRADVNLKAKWIRLPDTKNNVPRLVPLDQLAVKLWTLALMMQPREAKVFSVVEPSRYSLWYSVREEAGLGNADLHFHDSRHEAASQIAKRMELLPLCKMFGWTDTKHAMIYYNPTIEELVHQVDAGKNAKKGHKTLIEMQRVVIKG